MAAISKGSNFPETLVTEMFSKVRGKSALAALCNSDPIPFTGETVFTFSLDKEIDVVAENGAKTVGGGTVAPVKIAPVKVEYGMRISDEFVYASEETRLQYLRAFAEGFAKKIARGFDIMAIHGENPRTKAASSVIGANHFDSKVTNVITIQSNDTPDGNIEDAIGLVTDKEYDVDGMAIAPAFRADLAKQTTGDGAKMYPELAWGNNPGSVNGLRVETNSTVSFDGDKDRALVGNFEEAFKWGYAKEIPLEVIEYGNPDNDAEAGDLKGHNQVYLRAEAFIGWGILDPNAFAFVKAST